MNEAEVQEKHNEMNMIEQAQSAAARLEAANKAMFELVKRQELIESRRLFGGKSEAGSIPVEIPQAEKDKQDLKNYFKGTSLGELL